jgi:hypothetical protein
VQFTLASTDSLRGAVQLAYCCDVAAQVTDPGGKRSERGAVRQWRVKGWGAARAAVDDISRAIGAGVEPAIPRS